MIRVICPGCQTKYRFDEAQLGGRSHVTAKCKKCGGPIEIATDAAPPSDPPEHANEVTAPVPAAPAPATEVEPPRAAAPAPEGLPPSFEDSTARVQKLRSDEPVTDQTMTGEAVADVQLPQDKKYSLAVLQGKASGQIFEINRVRTVLGRAGCDVVLDDPEASRQHASLEIMGSRVMVADLQSTNGTFVNGEQVDRAELENHSEFRIGEHVLMLIVTDRE